MKQIRQLTTSEEQFILQSLKGGDCFDNGSSRRVYSMPMVVADMLGVDPDDYVVKLAMGLGGHTQQTREIEAYIKYGECYPLAHIPFYGKYIEIMEYVSTDNCVGLYRDYWYDNEEFDGQLFVNIYGCDEELNEDVIDEYGDYCSYDMPVGASDENIAEFEAVESAYMDLCDLFGDTSDNLQLGYNSDDKIVCYDYGFVAGSDETWSSSLVDHSQETIDKYLDTCCEDLTATDNLVEAFEKYIDMQNWRKFREENYNHRLVSEEDYDMADEVNINDEENKCLARLSYVVSENELTADDVDCRCDRYMGSWKKDAVKSFNDSRNAWIRNNNYNFLYERKTFLEKGQYRYEVKLVCQRG